MTRYLLVGGGTAGHVNPLLAVADELLREEPDAELWVLGTREGLEARLVPERGYRLLTVDRVPLPRALNRDLLVFPARLRRVVAQVRAHLLEQRIEVVVGFGGYVSAPAYLAARRARLTIVVHEANAKPGVANRLGSWLTRWVGVAFPGTRLRLARLTGMPLRREITGLDREASRPAALAGFGLDAARPVLLVTGGSQGAKQINETIASSASTITAAGWQILHITGERNPVEDPQVPGYLPIRYCDRMELAFAAADLVIARGGSATVSELTAIGLPAVYVPLAHGNGEQELNVRGVAVAGGAMVVSNAEFTPAWARGVLLPLLGDREAIAALGERAARIGVRDGAERTVALIREAVREEAS